MAKQAGWTNVDIARVVGITEAAVRLYLKRAKEHRGWLGTSRI
jgi:predicted transcriptional regulator